MGCAVSPNRDIQEGRREGRLESEWRVVADANISSLMLQLSAQMMPMLWVLPYSLMMNWERCNSWTLGMDEEVPLEDEHLSSGNSVWHVQEVFTKEMASHLTKHVWRRGNGERLWNEKSVFFPDWVDMSYRSAQCDGSRDGTKADRWTKRKFLGFVFPGCKDCQAHGELFKLWAWKWEWLHLSHILLKPLLQMCLPIPANYLMGQYQQPRVN